VLLLDEITVDLDVVGRLKLLAFFKDECEQRNATIVYATHIFDGLESWVTHLAYMENGQFIKGGGHECSMTVAKLPGIYLKLSAVVTSYGRNPTLGINVLCVRLCTSHQRGKLQCSFEFVCIFPTKFISILPGILQATNQVRFCTSLSMPLSTVLELHAVLMACLAAGPCPSIPELVEARKSGTKLLTIFESWLRSEREARHSRQQSQPKPLPGTEALQPQRTPFMPSKHLAFFR